MADVPLQCPSCCCEMTRTPVEPGQVWLCNGCGDFVMPAENFQQLVGARLEANPGQGHTACDCPGCKGAMDPRAVKGVIVDCCDGCGMVHSDRASFSYIIEASPGNQALGNALLGMDVARNVATASACCWVEAKGVEDLFVLYRNGVLLTSYTSNVAPDMDPEVMGSMLLAITGFVQTCFRTAGKARTLSSIRFEDREIAFEHGDHLVVALVVAGSLDADARKMIAGAIREIETVHRAVLGSWDGDLGRIAWIKDSFNLLIAPLRTGA